MKIIQVYNINDHYNMENQHKQMPQTHMNNTILRFNAQWPVLWYEMKYNTNPSSQSWTLASKEPSRAEQYETLTEMLPNHGIDALP